MANQFSTMIQHKEKYTHLYTNVSFKNKANKLMTTSKNITKDKGRKKNIKKVKITVIPEVALTTNTGLTKEHQFKRVFQTLCFEIKGVEVEIHNCITDFPLDIKDDLKKRLIGAELFAKQKKSENQNIQEKGIVENMENSLKNNKMDESLDCEKEGLIGAKNLLLHEENKMSINV